MIGNDGLLTVIVENLIDLIEKYDDIVGNLCGIDSLNEVISRKQGIILTVLSPNKGT